MEGWIKWHRKVLDNPIIMKDKDYFAVWGYLLLKATHKNHDTLFKGKRITLKPGQLIIGRKSIAEKLKIDESKVQRILKSFENEQQIEQQTTSQNRLISILNWHEYQESEQQDEQQVNNDCTTSEQRVNTNKNEKNIKNDKKTVEEDVGRTDGLQMIMNYYDKNVAPVTEYVLEMFQDYMESDNMESDLILEAIKVEIEENKKNLIKTPFKYIKAILNNWSKRGIKSVLELKKMNDNDISLEDIQEMMEEVK